MFGRATIRLGIGPHSSFICIVLTMAALLSRCGHHIFVWFLSSFFFSSLNLSGRRADVYDTSTHGVD